MDINKYESQTPKTSIKTSLLEDKKDTSEEQSCEDCLKEKFKESLDLSQEELEAIANKFIELGLNYLV